MQQYFLKLNPPRPTFLMDMTSDERATMQKHVAYWNDLLNNGVAIVFGPVMDPKGGYGAGVVPVDSEEHLKEIIANDPAKWIKPIRILFDAGGVQEINVDVNGIWCVPHNPRSLKG